MFTGLVQAIGTVREARRDSHSLRLSINPGSWPYAKRAEPGDSISVAGVCLTLVNRPTPRAQVFSFDVVAETLDKTRLGDLRPGDTVNLEHAATASTLLGGHLVQGHVDGVGNISRVQSGDDYRLWIDVPPALARFIVPKGSICIEGVSLTVAGQTPRGLWVALIPTTLELTTLGALRPGDPVNVEVDVIGKMVAGWVDRVLAARSPRAPSARKRSTSSPRGRVR